MKPPEETTFIVTGASGFMGTAFRRLLSRRGFPVISLSVRAEDCNRSGERPPAFGVDLPSRAIWVHLAGLRAKEPRPLKDYIRANVGLTARVMEAALRSQVEKFVHVSTVGVHGWPSRLPIDESFPISPLGRYHFSKALGERAILHAVTERGLPACIVRPAMVYGPGESAGFAVRLIQWCSHRRCPLPGNGRNRLHLLEVTDAAEGLLSACLQGGSDGSAYLLAGPRPCTLAELVSEIRSALGVRGPCVSLPSPALRLAAIPGDAAHRFQSRTGIRVPGAAFMPTSLQVDLVTRDRYYNTERARLELGFRPGVDPATGIRMLADWMTTNGLIKAS
jgi:dihydroflavonol-4-reductase